MSRKLAKERFGGVSPPISCHSSAGVSVHDPSAECHSEETATVANAADDEAAHDDERTVQKAKQNCDDPLALQTLSSDIRQLRAQGRGPEARTKLLEHYAGRLESICKHRANYSSTSWDALYSKGFVRGSLYDENCNRFDGGSKDPRANCLSCIVNLRPFGTLDVEFSYSCFAVRVRCWHSLGGTCSSASPSAS
jgi:hypothetical protein